MRFKLLVVNNLIRQTHRWVSIAFTLTVIANFVAMAVRPGQQPPPAVTYAPLLPLFLLLLTGLYLFVLPYISKKKAAGAPTERDRARPRRVVSEEGQVRPGNGEDKGHGA